jgi:hypothetical protein
MMLSGSACLLVNFMYPPSKKFEYEDKSFLCQLFVPMMMQLCAIIILGETLI